MFKHIFENRLRCILRNRVDLFWSSLFPLLLATLFYVALGNLNTATAFSSIPLAVVDDAAYHAMPGLSGALEDASQGETPLFSPIFVSGEEALRMLEDDETTGMLQAAGEGLTLTFRSNGIRQSIVKEFADTYLQTAGAAQDIIRKNPLAALRLPALSVPPVPIKDDPSTGQMDQITTYFFALIAMACMYGGFQGLTAVAVTQANQSTLAVRNAMAPAPRLTQFAASLCAAALVQFLSILLLLFYLRFAFGVNFGDRAVLILLTCLTGSLMGVGLGAMISALIKGKEGLKIAILLTVSMLGSFLSGMMVGGIKYALSKSAPVLSYINPVNLIADAFHSLYLFPTLSRFYMNLGLMAAFTLVFLAGAVLAMRRQKYASL